MAALHSALGHLAPINFSDVPKTQEELEPFLTDLLSQAQLIVESIPIPDSEGSSSRHGSHTSLTSSASKISASSARSPPPAPEHAALQKEWGKPIKLSAKENPMHLSVYKMAGKDGKGTWFARRSVHEGLGFRAFERAFEREFPTSLAVHGAPGEGNIRGIGAETKVEEIMVPNRGKIEVYRLSAQFPGPTTPRDFVTCLVTSSKAIKKHNQTGKASELTPRHYMIISKPCNHPETQPRDGFIRGQYESVEFIREVPRKLKTSTSSTNLTERRHELGHSHAPSLQKQTLIHSAEKVGDLLRSGQLEETDCHNHLNVSNPRGSSSRETSPSGRRRSATVDVPRSPVKPRDPGEPYDPEENPVEWIMVTRSNPGGSVPRFLVERGTPSSICADAQKFLDWACQQDEEARTSVADERPRSHHRESFASWEANGTLAGIREHEESQRATRDDHQVHRTAHEETVLEDQRESHEAQGPLSPTPELLALGAGAPPTVLDHLPDRRSKVSPTLGLRKGGEDDDRETRRPYSPSHETREDASSIVSTTSFASADSHLTSIEEPSISSKSSADKTSGRLLTRHEKELAKLLERKAALSTKFASTRDRLAKGADKESAKELQALKVAEEKHERELRKHEEKYQKELAKLEQKKKSQAEKLEAKRRKQADKDEKARLTRERNEAWAELELLKKEQEIWQKQIGELQKENGLLRAKLAKSDAGLVSSPAEGSGAGGRAGPGRFRAFTLGNHERSQSSSLLSPKKATSRETTWSNEAS